MLLKHVDWTCYTTQGTRTEETKCIDCKQKWKEDCTTKLLDQKINENVKRLNALFNFRKSHDEH